MIKRILISIAGLLFASVTLFAQNEGVRFFNGTFDEALQQAKKDNMLLIMDCYTSWCGPCKNMTDNVFPTKTCGDFFNGKFVFIKVDMEKGEGLELKKRFGVRSFPTFLILNGDGIEQHRLIGGGKAELFIERVKVGSDPKTSMFGLMKRYNDGERGAEFMERYVNTLFEVRDKERGTKTYDAYYDSLSDDSRMKPENWWLFNLQNFSDFGSAKFEYLLKNKNQFIQNIGAVKYNERIGDIVAQEYELHITGNTKDLINGNETIEQREERLLLCKVKDERIKLLRKFYCLIRNGDLEGYRKKVEHFFKKLDDEKGIYFFELYSSNFDNKIERLKFSNSLGRQLIANIENNEYVKRVEAKISMNNRIIEVLEKYSKKGHSQN